MSYYYVSSYDCYPIYEAAEGGYYYEGRGLASTARFRERKKALRLLRRLRKEAKQYAESMCYGPDTEYFCSNDGTYFGVKGPYVGNRYFVTLEKVPGAESAGRVPYS